MECSEGKKGIEDVKIYKTLIVKGFGWYESVWNLFSSVDSHVNLCPGQDQTDSLFSPGAGNFQSFCVLNKEIQDSDMTFLFLFLEFKYYGQIRTWKNSQDR